MSLIGRKIIVIGTSGAGKSTLGRRLSDLLGYPHVEFDALRWDADWTVSPAFSQKLASAMESAEWIMDGNFMEDRTPAWEQADTVVWLDYSLPRLFSRLFPRTVKRVFTREKYGTAIRKHFFSNFSQKTQCYIGW